MRSTKEKQKEKRSEAQKSEAQEKRKRKKERSTKEKEKRSEAQKKKSEAQKKKEKNNDEDERAVEAELDHVVDFVWRFDRDVLYARDGTQAFVRPCVRARTGNFDLVLDRDPRCAVGQTTHRAVRIIIKIKNKQIKNNKKK